MFTLLVVLNLISNHSYHIGDSALQSLDLNSNSNLTSFSVLLFFRFRPMLEFAEEWLRGMLNKITGEQLKELELIWSCKNVQEDLDFGIIDWSTLDKLLTGPRFPALQEITFRQPLSQRTTAPIPFVCEGLHRCHSRGLLRFA